MSVVSTTAARTARGAPRAPRDLHWVRGALQSAVAIEHATMPLYAAAMYSLEVQNYPAYNTLRSVLMEEMLHMAAACNALAALGGAPRIKQLDPAAVLRGLPGTVAPGLTARLGRLSRRQLETFMRIEAPVELLPPAQREAPYPTIGSFYAEVQDVVVEQADAVRAAARGRLVANQVGGNLGYAVVDPGGDVVEQLLDGLDLIMEQGEGEVSTRSSGAGSQHEPSHYARFAELRFGRGYTGPADVSTTSAEGQRRWFQGPAIAWPTVINSLAVPADGYAAVLRLDPDRVEVERALRRFDQAYTRMLQALDDAWNGPAEQSWPSLGAAVAEMNELRVISCFDVLRRPVPAAAVERLAELYPAEHPDLAALTDLSAPVFYGPRFRNLSLR